MAFQSGVMSRFPFGPFAFTRLDEQLKDDPEWKAAKEKNPDVDPMGQSAGQPHIECVYILFPCHFAFSLK